MSDDFGLFLDSVDKDTVLEEASRLAAAEPDGEERPEDLAYYISALILSEYFDWQRTSA